MAGGGKKFRTRNCKALRGLVSLTDQFFLIASGGTRFKTAASDTNYYI